MKTFRHTINEITAQMLHFVATFFRVYIHILFEGFGATLVVAYSLMTHGHLSLGLIIIAGTVFLMFHLIMWFLAIGYNIEEVLDLLEKSAITLTIGLVLEGWVMFLFLHHTEQIIFTIIVSVFSLIKMTIRVIEEL